MTVQATNPDLSLGNQRPGVFVAVNLNAPGGGVGQVQRRMLILAYKQATGTAPQDNPFQPLSQQEVNDGCGARSDSARGYAAAIAEVGAGNIDIFVCPVVEPSGGTAATYKLIVGGPATAGGSVDFSIDGRAIISVGFSSGDTAASIAANIKTAVENLVDVPVTVGIASATLTFTYIHKGAVGEDLPFRGFVNGTGTGVTLSPGQVVFTNTGDGVAGSATLTVGATTITVPLAGTETAAQAATLLFTAINAGSYPFTATNGTPGTVDLYFAKGRDVRRYTAAIVTTGTLAVSTSTGGTAGAGVPTLTTAITNLGKLTGFAGWGVPFVGTQASPDLTTLGTIAAYVELQANGVNQSEQRVHACAPWPSSTVGTIPVGTAPTLTSSPRYAMAWCQDSGVQGFEIACRLAAARVNNDYPPKNWDGYALHSSVAAPLPLPAPPSRPSGDVINIAMRSLFLCPIRVNDPTNQLVIEKATTTSNSSYLPLRDWGCIDQIAFWRYDLARELVDQFHGVNVKKFSPPRTVNTITPGAVADAAYLLALLWDDNDLYDGAETFRAGFQSKINVQAPTRIDLQFPMSPVINVHQIGAIGNLVSPSSST